MCINHSLACLLIKIITTSSNEVYLNNNWPLLVEAGLEDGKDDIHIFDEINKKKDKNIYYCNIF